MTEKEKKESMKRYLIGEAKERQEYIQSVNWAVFPMPDGSVKVYEREGKYHDK